MRQEFETVIGLEVHIQLNTKSKAFSSDNNEFNLQPNIHISHTTLALPGSLPKANVLHIEKGIKLCIALDSKINRLTRFDRKNYFYPDLPKGYQITQDKLPIGVGGSFTFLSDGEEKKIRIHHLHLEEDAGKSNHELDQHFSFIEFNRAGSPLIELVTEPDLRSGQEVHDFLAGIQQLVQYLEISDGNMEEGSIRCDCNVSVRPYGQEAFGERCEIKNVNSKKFAKQAVSFESNRQQQMIEKGGFIEKTTMLFEPSSGSTKPMRKKETENDYRYFTEPDLSPIEISEDTIHQIKSEIDWLPWEMKAKLSSLGLLTDEVNKISESKKNARYFLDIVQNHEINERELASLFVNKLMPESITNNTLIEDVIYIDNIISFINLFQSGKVTKSSAYSTLWPAICKNPMKKVEVIAEELNLFIQDNQQLVEDIINDIIASYPDKVKEYKNGKKGLLGFFMGQVNMKSGVALNPQILKEKIENLLKTK